MAAIGATVLVALCGAAGPASAQVTFDEVEAALTALEAANGALVQTTSDPLPTLPPTEISDPGTTTATLPAELPTAVPTADIPVPEAQTTGGERVLGGYEFLPILTDQSCPIRIAEIGAEAEKLYEIATRTEAEALSLRARFDTLEEQNRAYELDDSILECPSRFVRDIEALLVDLNNFDLSVLVQEAETLSVCAQDGSQIVNSRMTELAASDDPSAARDRVALGGVLERWAAADAQVSQAVSTFVFYNQRRTRLAAATDGILRRCELLDGY